MNRTPKSPRALESSVSRGRRMFGSRARFYCVLAVLLGVFATFSPSGTVSRAQSSTSTAGVAKDISKLEDELGKLEKSLADKQKAQADNVTAQAAARRTGDEEKIRILKRDQATLGTEANEIQMSISAKDREIEEKYATLRTAAQSEMEKLLSDAATAAGAGNDAAAATAVKSASDAYGEWKRGVDRWKPYEHKEEALVKPALEDNRKRAESEQAALESGVARLKAERSIEEKELKAVDAMIARNIAHADWPPLQEKLKEMRKKIAANKSDIDRRIKALEGREKTISDYLKGK